MKWAWTSRYATGSTISKLRPRFLSLKDLSTAAWKKSQSGISENYARVIYFGRKAKARDYIKNQLPKLAKIVNFLQIRECVTNWNKAISQARRDFQTACYSIGSSGRMAGILKCCTRKT